MTGDCWKKRRGCSLNTSADLKEQQHVPLVQLQDNKLLRRYIEHTLHLAVEACLDT
ncbi:MAG: hypothetical protein IBX71_08005 [Candidatus Desulforudis sp.]|nr:hypothetical protein [Desulforudis sp.]